MKSDDFLMFDDYKEEILLELNKRLKSGKINFREEVNMVHGFFNRQCSPTLESALGGPMVPTVALIGEDSGQLYFFSLKHLLPNLKC